MSLRDRHYPWAGSPPVEPCPVPVTNPAGVRALGSTGAALLRV
jgi:hypothetical protein